jgi:pimeloyl-ACP methyl ester carboxylesterase
MCDPVLGAPVLRQWQNVFPQAETHVVEDASHFVPEDAPERLVAWIETFLAAHP